MQSWWCFVSEFLFPTKERQQQQLDGMYHDARYTQMDFAAQQSLTSPVPPRTSTGSAPLLRITSHNDGLADYPHLAQKTHLTWHFTPLEGLHPRTHDPPERGILCIRTIIHDGPKTLAQDQKDTTSQDQDSEITASRWDSVSRLPITGNTFNTW